MREKPGTRYTAINERLHQISLLKRRAWGLLYKKFSGTICKSIFSEARFSFTVNNCLDNI